MILGFSLTQPWASAIAHGAKRIETRDWQSGYRGWVAIHASRAFPPFAREACLEEPLRAALVRAGLLACTMAEWAAWGDGQDSWLLRVDGKVAAMERLPRGAIVAVANLHHVGEIRAAAPDRGPGAVYVHPSEHCVGDAERAVGNYALGRYGWVFTGIQALAEPIPCKGALSLWPVPADVEDQIDAQVGHQATTAAPGTQRRRDGEDR